MQATSNPPVTDSVRSRELPSDLSSTVQNAHRLLHRELRDVVTWDYSPHNVVEEAQPPRPDTANRTPGLLSNCEIWSPR